MPKSSWRRGWFQTPGSEGKGGRAGLLNSPGGLERARDGFLSPELSGTSNVTPRPLPCPQHFPSVRMNQDMKTRVETPPGLSEAVGCPKRQASLTHSTPLVE